MQRNLKQYIKAKKILSRVSFSQITIFFISLYFFQSILRDLYILNVLNTHSMLKNWNSDLTSFEYHQFVNTSRDQLNFDSIISIRIRSWYQIYEVASFNKRSYHCEEINYFILTWGNTCNISFNLIFVRLISLEFNFNKLFLLCLGIRPCCCILKACLLLHILIYLWEGAWMCFKCLVIL